MTHLDTGSVTIPPDSTGKKISTTARTLLFFDNLQTGKKFLVGDTITTDAGAQGTVEGVNTAGFPTNEGALYLSDVTGTFANDAQIKVLGVFYADVNTTGDEGQPVTEYYIQNQVIVDPSNPEKKVSVTDQNELRVTLPDGSLESNDSLTITQLIPALTFNFDYIAGTDPAIVCDEIWIKYTNGVNIGSGFTVNSLVRGKTSGAYGHVRATDTVNSILKLKNVVYGQLTQFQAGEVIENMDLDTVESCEVVDTGEIAANTTTRSLELKTGGTIAGLAAKETSHFYVPLSRGSNTEIQFAIATTEATPGVTRRFGLFNEEQGFFWEILESNGTNTDYDSSGAEDTGGNTILCAVHRTNSSGSVVDNFIPQNSFNVNGLDGTDNQGFTIDISRVNLYWISIPNDGAGTAEFGVFNDIGEKIVAHRFYFSNNSTFPYNPAPISTLPFRAEVINNGAGTPAQSTTLKVNKITAFRFSNEEELPSFNHGNSTTQARVFDSTAGEIPIIGIRPRLTYGPLSYKNRARIRLNDISVSLIDSRIDREFDAANDINAGTDEITIKNHGILDGTPVYYQNNGNANVSGLEDYGIYYSIAVDDDTIQLSNTYTGAVVDPGSSEINIATGLGNHKIVGLTDGPAILRIRKGTAAADSTWNPHNVNRAGTEWAQGATGFRVGKLVTVASGGTGYSSGDLLEFDAGILNHREAVVEVVEHNSGAISRVRIAGTGVGHGLESDGSTSANYGSYNKQFTSNTVGHKANGVGLSSTTGSGALFGTSVEWGHGFWWNSIYGQWFEFELDGKNSHLGKEDNLDVYTYLNQYEDGQLTLFVTAEAQTPKKDINIQANLNWDEVI